MPNEIRPILPQPIEPDGTKKTQKGMTTADGKSFKDILVDSINKVNQMQVEADKAIENLLTGKTDKISEVLSAVKKAELAFNTLMQIRNKLIEAYEEIMRMRI